MDLIITILPVVVVNVCCVRIFPSLPDFLSRCGSFSNLTTQPIRAVLMGIKSCTKILNFSTRFSCENLAVEDFVTLLMGKKSC